MASDIRWSTSLDQCGTATLTWTGGLPPARVEIYQQSEANAAWNGTGLIYDVDGQSLNWVVSVAAATRVWATIVDHAGSYNQSLEPGIVQTSDDNHCLLQLVDADTLGHNTSRATWIGVALAIPLLASILLNLLLFGRLRRRPCLPPARRQSLKEPRQVLEVDSRPVSIFRHASHDESPSLPEILISVPPTPAKRQSSLLYVGQDPFADLYRVSTTGTARDHIVDQSAGPLQVRNGHV